MPAVHGRDDASGPRRLRRRPLLRALPLAVITLIGLAAFPVSAPAEPVLASGGRDTDAVVAGFRTPMFLIPLFRSAERASGVPWQVLAAINEIETDYGRNLAVSPAGAVGWMQFMPATWRAFGVDADGDGRRDPWDRADAIFAAARYLRDAGAEQDLRRAIFAYNHADWYVDEVLAAAERLTAIPDGVIASLESLAGGRLPVPSSSRYRSAEGADGTAVAITSRPGSPVVAVNDAEVIALGRSQRRGAFVVLRDAAGNRYRYERLGRLAATHVETGDAYERATGRVVRKDRLFAQPLRRHAWRHGGYEQVVSARAGTDANTGSGIRVGTTVAAGSLLGATSIAGGTAAAVRFSVRLPGRAMPWIDPHPLLDGWRTAELDGDRLAIARTATGGAGTAPRASDGLLARRVLGDPRISMYRCGRDDVARGLVDRRVLSLLSAMAEEGLSPTVSSLRCGHSYLTASGNVSEHNFGSAVDISAINGVPVAGHQDRGGIAERTVRWLLQRPERPHQIISLLDLGGPSFALADHDNHVHVGFRPGPVPDGTAPSRSAVPSSAAWRALLTRALPLATDGRPRLDPLSPTQGDSPSPAAGR